jgi:hypothetical protein
MTIYGCTCPKPNRKQWAVVHYCCNFSAFSGYHRTSSDYSLITCLQCGHHWRTKAKYVMGLYMMTDKDREQWRRSTFKLPA